MSVNNKIRQRKIIHIKHIPIDNLIKTLKDYQTLLGEGYLEIEEWDREFSPEVFYVYTRDKTEEEKLEEERQAIVAKNIRYERYLKLKEEFESK